MGMSLPRFSRPCQALRGVALVTLLVTVVIPTSVASNPAAACPVTVPNNNLPSPDLLELFRFPSVEDGYFHGNGRLWLGMWWPKGVLRSHGLEFNPDGSLSVKTPWFRSPEAAGDLTISGRRLDGEVPPLRVDVPDGYGEVGFQVSGINYPTPGCWEVTGTVQDVSLTFVVFVVFEPPFPGSAPIDSSTIPRLAPRCAVTTNDADTGGVPEHVSLGYTLEASGTPPAAQFPGEDEYFGEDGLWTTLWPDGIIAVSPRDVRSDGSIGVRFSWYRDELARGRLVLAGTRLDGAAPPLRASALDGYGDVGYQPTDVTFPTAGCWEVTATSGDATLTFITLVMTDPDTAPATPVGRTTPGDTAT